MAIKFKYNENGELVAYDENGNELGTVSTMGDEIKSIG